jgi:hypothetical protein
MEGEDSHATSRYLKTVHSHGYAANPVSMKSDQYHLASVREGIPFKNTRSMSNVHLSCHHWHHDLGNCNENSMVGFIIIGKTDDVTKEVIEI